MPGKRRRRSLRISGVVEAAADNKGKKKMIMKHGGGSSSDEEEDHYKLVAGVEGAAAVLPEKAVLELILDTLQRRDIYDIFGEPVNPQKCEEEDYYKTIQGREAMDFGTMRAKLHEGMYTRLDQFQYDVLLITRNAMRFNQSSTIFYKQAHVIDELAKKVFHLLLTSSNPEEFRKQLIREEEESAPTRRRSSSRIRRPPTRAPASTSSAAANRRSSSSVPIHGNPSSRTAATAKCSNQLPQYDRRSTYNRIGNDQENAPTTNIQTLQLIVQQEEQQDEIIRYKESLTQFVKNLGPTAKKVAKMKLLPLCNISALPGRTITLSSNVPLNPIASDHHHSTATPTTHILHQTVRSNLRRPVILALPCSTDITKKKAVTHSSCNINPGSSIRKNRAPPLQEKLQQDSGLNHNSSRINVSATSTTIPMTVGDAAQQFIPSAPQFKFDLQFLQTRLHQMKYDERPPRPPPPVPSLLLQDKTHASNQSTLMESNNNNSMQDLADLYRAHLSLHQL